MKNQNENISDMRIPDVSIKIKKIIVPELIPSTQAVLKSDECLRILARKPGKRWLIVVQTRFTGAAATFMQKLEWRDVFTKRATPEQILEIHLLLS